MATLCHDCHETIDDDYGCFCECNCGTQHDPAVSCEDVRGEARAR